ncbi:MAG: chemotaxis response regulator protein-glutamate methylesterase [Ignavibacteria bacterium]|nr:chemotaxis response regulator protein-glutamate methylesterase [Ignavibacteria bacterium]MCU7512519.1 chemotaxis response regulator protein-glutamate methylesterase [Ignavibacteria bacterium]
MLNKIRAVVVDDSAFMRKSLSIMLESDGDIEVIGTARDGLDGLNLIKEKRPDIVTLDIEMPRMDGLTALGKIMAECPTSVIMVSSITTEGAEATLKALELGAVDFIPKELSYVSVNIVKIKEDLIRKVKEIVRQKSVQMRLRRIQNFSPSESRPAQSLNAPLRSLPRAGYRAIALGVSTGGPMSLQKVVPVLSKNINCPMFIVQHMPPKFTKSLADRLNSMSNLEVKEAEHNETVKNGTVYLAPGGFHMTAKKTATGSVVIDISEAPATTLHRPSVDVMMSSVLKVYGKSTLGIIMTGMGKDGFEAIKELKTMGGYTVAQDEQSCVVYGMPKAVVDAGYADVIAPLEKIAEIVNKAVV